MIRALAGALLALLLLALPVTAKVAPSFDLSPGPYHYGGTVTAVTHGDYNISKTAIRMLCFQDGAMVYGEFFLDPEPDTPYVFHFGLGRPGDVWQGGAADCDIRFDESRPPYHHYGQVFFHVEA